MKRRADWAARLQAFLQRRRSGHFEVAGHCGFFAADVVEAMTGIDPAADWRRAEPMAKALARLRRAGFDDHIAFAASLLPEIAASEAQDGDLAVIETEDGPGFGVFVGAAVFALGEAEMVTVSRLKAVKAFRVGE